MNSSSRIPEVLIESEESGRDAQTCKTPISRVLPPSTGSFDEEGKEKVVLGRNVIMQAKEMEVVIVWGERVSRREILWMKF